MRKIKSVAILKWEFRMAMFAVEQKQLKLFLRLSEVLFPAMMIMQSFRIVNVEKMGVKLMSKSAAVFI